MPWGFAPFHYGRWVVVHNRWCWSPGTYVRRPVYAPALVGWVDAGRLRTRHHGPHVGWFPLAPREVYVPSYRVSTGYVQRVNVTHVTNIVNVTTIVRNPNQVVRDTDYRNYRHANAVTVVPQTVMVNRQPVAAAAAQWRNDPSSRQWAGQPARNVAVVAPQVATPVITPAIQQARRIRPTDDRPRGMVGVSGSVGQPQPAAVTPQAAPPVVIPPAPGRVRGALIEPRETREPRAQTHDRPRRHEVPESPRQAAPVMVTPTPHAAPQPVVRPPQPVAVPAPQRPATIGRPQPMPAQVAPVAVPVQPAQAARPPQAQPAPVARPPQPAQVARPPQAQPAPVAVTPTAPAPQVRENRNPNRDDVPGRGAARGHER